MWQSLPLLHGNWIDLVIIVVLFWYFLDGLGQNFLTKTLELLGFILSFLSALKFYSFFSFLLIGNFSLPKGISDAAGFFLAAIITESVFSFLTGFFLAKIPKQFFSHQLNRFLGFLPAVINGVILTAFLATLIISLPVNPALKSAIFSSKLGALLVYQTGKWERQIAKIFGGAASETLNFLTIRPESQEWIDLHFKTQEFSVDAFSEQTMFNLVNKERQDRGIRPLVLDIKLQEVARAHAQDMLKRGYFSHNSPEGLTPFDRMENAGISFAVAAENLALAPNVNIAHIGLMNSPGHKANILNPDFGKMGIGVIDGGVYGKMFVQEFTN